MSLLRSGQDRPLRDLALTQRQTPCRPDDGHAGRLEPVGTIQLTQRRLPDGSGDKDADPLTNHTTFRQVNVSKHD